MQTSIGNKYFFDNDYLILKLMNRAPASPLYYERGGARIYTIQNSYRYIVNATNCGGGAVYCDFAAEQPPSYLVV